MQPLVAQPESIKGQKTDYNDVYRRYGSAIVKKQFVPQYTIDPKAKITEATKLKSIMPIHQETTAISDYHIPDHTAKEVIPTKNKDILEKNIGERDM